MSTVKPAGLVTCKKQCSAKEFARWSRSRNLYEPVGFCGPAWTTRIWDNQWGSRKRRIAWIHASNSGRKTLLCRHYHKLDHKLLEKLTYTYLDDWIRKQEEAVAAEESGADDRLVKARQLQEKLKIILDGEAPCDVFVRWKPLEQQPIGWHPDLNDGVRLNIRPFMEADVLRKRPNIKWGVDRGKNPPGSPWGEERDNDKHLTLAEKLRARET